MTKSIHRSILTLAMTLCLISLGVVAELDFSHVEWDQSSPITWDLFQGTPPPDAHQRTEAAAIHMTISWRASYSVSSSNGGTSWLGQIAAITVTNTMEPASSWVVPGKEQDSVLSHEQLHFDLNEVYRRKLECLLLETSACQASTQQAAVDQLKRWGESLGVDVIAHQAGADAGAVVYDTLQAARSRKIDEVIIDTAGRLHTKFNLMEELKKIRRVAAKDDTSAPHEVILALDATTGQNGLTQSRYFTEAVGVTGIFLAKLDGTAKGGIVLAICDELKIPIKFVGVGEKLEDMVLFNAETFVEALCS